MSNIGQTYDLLLCGYVFSTNKMYFKFMDDLLGCIHVTLVSKCPQLDFLSQCYFTMLFGGAQYQPCVWLKGKSQRTVMLDSYQITSVSVANNAAYDLFTGLRWEYTLKYVGNWT